MRAGEKQTIDKPPAFRTNVRVPRRSRRLKFFNDRTMRFRSAVMASRLKLVDVAEMMGRSLSTVEAWHHGARTIPAFTLEVLETRLAAFCSGKADT